MTDYNANRREKYKNNPDYKIKITKQTLLCRYKQLSIEDIEYYITKYTEIIELYKEALAYKKNLSK